MLQNQMQYNKQAMPHQMVTEAGQNIGMMQNPQGMMQRPNQMPIPQQVSQVSMQPINKLQTPAQFSSMQHSNNQSMQIHPGTRTPDKMAE
jgi:hypothetical protein